MTKFRGKFRKLLILFPWLFFAGFCLIYFDVRSNPVFLYSIFHPLLLGIYAGHEVLLVSPSLPWALGFYAVLGSFIFLHPNPPENWGTLSLLIQWALMGFSVIFLNRSFSRTQRQSLKLKEDIDTLGEALKSKLKENDFYQAKIQNLKSQIGERRRLSAYAREMGTLLDPTLIRHTLVEKTKNLFPGGEVSLRTALSEDSVDFWVGDRKSSILIKDFDQDKRIPETPAVRNPASKAVIAAPLLVGKKLMGLIRIDSPAPGRFSETDLQRLEVYASLATLALENAQLFSEVNAMATQDGLTGLATHRIFQEKLQEELLRCARYHTSVSLIMADIDHFKLVNDQHGHLAGDQVLKETAAILKARLRPVDFAARYGGEEFALILPGLDLREAGHLAEDIRGELEFHSISTGGKNLSITASFGCAAFPVDAQIASQLIRKADERLYEAKTSGRNRIVTV